MPEPYILCTICARGGSKGVPGKNLRPLKGEPLIVHTVRTAQRWGAARRIIASTESPEIAAVAREAGAEAPFLRPAELATDATGKWEVLRHAVREVERSGPRVDIVVDLDPTSPLRSVEDIRGCVELFLRDRPDGVITVYESYKNPYFNMVELEDGYAVLSKRPAASVTRRQDAPRVYSMNASIYVYDRDFLLSAGGLFEGRLRVFIMPPDRSVDIDREIDFQLVELLMTAERSAGA